MTFSTSSIVSFTEGFPPAHKLAQTVTSIDYVKHFHNFMEAIEIMVAITLIVGDVARYVWENGGKEMAVNFCQKVYIYSGKFAVWFIDVAVPAIENAIESTIAAGKRSREVWEMLNSPMFATL